MTPHSVCIIGLGYVGLPLAHAIAKAGYETSGYDVNSERIAQLKEGNDITGELSADQLQEVTINFSDDPSVISTADIVILAIPTPVDADHKPDLSMLENATRTVAQHIKADTIIIYESTVYPGVTEGLREDIERESNGKNFSLGYSPERVNPGDKEHTIDKIVKVVAGEDEKTADILCEFYGSFVKAGVHRAPNIKVAEMAKAIENAQRDLNIAFVNEVAMLCNAIGIETTEVLAAAGTKWNFLAFKPGLVGGHCIGVDPYYLVEKAKQMGMSTEVITAGRSTNDGMGTFVADQIHQFVNTDSKVLILGLTFKENVPDIRNAQSKDVIAALEKLGHTVSSHDAKLQDDDPSGEFDAVALLVPHQKYLDEDITKYAKEGGLIYDLKSVLNKKNIEDSGRRYKAL